MASTVQREQRRRRRKKVRRLSGVRVDEVSLVDNPAVPDATWLIAKRGEGKEMTAIAPAAPTAAPSETIEKAVEKVAPELTVDEADANVAKILAAADSLTAAADSIRKSLDEFCAAVKKSANPEAAPAAPAAEQSPPLTAEPVEPPATAAPEVPGAPACAADAACEVTLADAGAVATADQPDPTDVDEPAVPEESLLVKAGRLFRERREADAQKANQQLGEELIKSIAAMNERLASIHSFADRIGDLEERFDKARGKVKTDDE